MFSFGVGSRCLNGMVFMCCYFYGVLDFAFWSQSFLLSLSLSYADDAGADDAVRCSCKKKFAKNVR